MYNIHICIYIYIYIYICLRKRCLITINIIIIFRIYSDEKSENNRSNNNSICSNVSKLLISSLGIHHPKISNLKTGEKMDIMD